MKKFLKIIGALVGIVVLLIVLGVSFIAVKGIPSYDVEEVDYSVKATPERIERGKKLASMLCASCHINRETGKLTGGRMTDAPPEFGVIYSQNITQDKKFGIGEWSDKDIMYLLRTGIKPNGEYAPPYMAKLPTMADEDMASIIAFLRSDDPMVNPEHVMDQPCEPSFLTKMLCNMIMKPFPLPDGPIAMPDTNNSVELGKYLAHNLDCFSCHSADFKTNDFLNPVNSVGYFGGGNKPLNLEGKVKTTPNLTPDKETGIGNWTPEQFIKAVKYGIKDGEAALQIPMAPYVQLTDMEAKAIYDYLMTIPPISNKVERNIY